MMVKLKYKGYTIDLENLGSSNWNRREYEFSLMIEKRTKTLHKWYDDSIEEPDMASAVRTAKKIIDNGNMSSRRVK